MRAVTPPADDPSRPDPPSLAIGTALAALLLGWTLQWSNGTFEWPALLRLTLVIAVAIVALVAPRIGFLARHAALAPWALAAGQLCQLSEILYQEPAVDLIAEDAATLLPFRIGASLACAVAIACAARGRVGKLAFPALLVLHVALGVWIVRNCPRPFIDVHVFQRDAAAHLLHGGNPYTMDFPDIYGGKSPLPYYGTGMSVDGRLKFGFIYPPLSLLAALPGHLVGDHRYSLLAATTVTAALIGYARPGPWARLAAATLLLTPRGFYALSKGWTEPYLGLALAATVFAAVRRSRAQPIAFGLMLAVKQYAALALPLAPLLWPLPRPQLVRRLLVALAVAAAITVPFAVAAPGAFWHAVVALQAKQPFRPDALAFPAALVALGAPQLPGWIALVATAGAVLLALRRAPRSPAGFAAAVAATYLAFFAFNKQAFCNYYSFVVAALCCAAGVAALPQPSRLDR
jgi:hypothetical protein